MPFVVESLKQLIDMAEAGYAPLANEMPADERKIKARNLAYVCNKNLTYTRFMGKQIIPTSADRDYLEAHCAVKGIFSKHKTAAYGTAFVKGLRGTVLAAGTVLIRKSDNMKYQTTENLTLLGDWQSVKIQCLSKGSQGNAAADEILDFAVIVPGVESIAKVEIIGSGADEETTRDLLIRYLEYIRNTYHGGADKDYVKWALQVEGVNRAWAYPCEQGIGTVTVRIMTPLGFPDAILLKKVEDYINTVRPPTYNEFFVVSPIEKKIAHHLMIKPDTEDNRAAVSAALSHAYDIQDKPGGLLLLKDLHSALLSVTALEDYRIDEPHSNIQLATGEYGVLGEIEWLQQ